MSANLFFDLQPRPLDANGVIMPGCYYTFFESETTTPTPVYADGDLDTELDNPLAADADGRFPAIYMDSSVVYRVQLHDASDVLIYDVDPVHPFVTMPPGTIVMFYGDVTARNAAYPLALFEVCDGDNSTPDMRDRAPVGVSNTKAMGDTGGSISGTTSSNGSHTHTGSTGSVILTSANMPVHHHRIYAWNVNGANSTLDGFAVSGHVSVAGEVASGGAYITSNAGSDQIIEDTGTASPDGHTHSISSDGAHTHTVDTQGPWLALWFLMRKA